MFTETKVSATGVMGMGSATPARAARESNPYPILSAFTRPLKKPERPVVGRDAEMRSMMAAMARPELCNVMLLAPAGSGKTMLVQGLMVKDTGRLYWEVDLARMASGLRDNNELAARVKGMFDETFRYVHDTGREVVLFIDEFHQVVQLSAAAVEALKPMLADSGTRGIRVIAATTYDEFRKWVQPNQPLMERFQRFNLKEPDKGVVVSILRGMASRYKVSGHFYNDSLFELIYEYTNRYIPANSQPRKSILVLDSMIGWYRQGRKLDLNLLADVIYESEGVNVSFRVDARGIKRMLDEKVLAQEYATTVVEQRLQICVADLNNKGKPMSSFLFCGSTGVGKTELSKQLADIMFGDERSLIRIDCTEYALPESLERFRKELTSRVWERPYCILLLDEVEKACSECTRLLLQVLDDGRLLDVNNREVTFRNCYVIMTTNAGSEIYKTIANFNVDDRGSGRELRKYDKLIRKSIIGTTNEGGFPPELLGRINCIVPFQPLSRDVKKRIVRMRLDELKDSVMKTHGILVEFHGDVVPYIVDDNLDSDSDSGGARAIMSKLEDEVTMAVSRFINTYDGVTHLLVTVGGEMACRNEYKLESSAYIEVAAVK